MTREEHRERHILLHQMLDELIADYLTHVRKALPSTTTVLQLLEWSHAQTIEPATVKGVDE